MIYINGTMNSGKTAQAIMLSNQAKSQGKKVKVFKVEPERSNAEPTEVKSRCGLSCEGTLIGPNYDFAKYMQLNYQDVDMLIIDECQFLSVEQIDYLAYLNTRVILSGLKVDYLGNIFEAIQRLLTYRPMEVELFSLCSAPGCTEMATHHLLKVNGKVVREGNNKILGDVVGDTIKYSTVCKHHYLFQVTEKSKKGEEEICHLD